MCSIVNRISHITLNELVLPCDRKPDLTLSISVSLRLCTFLLPFVLASIAVNHLHIFVRDSHVVSMPVSLPHVHGCGSLKAATTAAAAAACHL